MAELSQKDQLALHEFSVRYRAALAKQHTASEKSLQAFFSGVKEDYEQEQAAKRDQAAEPPAAASEHQIEDPDEGR